MTFALGAAVALPSGAARAADAFAISPVVAAGDPSPLGGAFSLVGEPVLVGAQHIAFFGRSDVIVVRTATGLQTIAAAGDSSPAGGSFTTLGPAAITPSGDVVFYASARGGPAGLFVWRDDTLARLAAAGDVLTAGGFVIHAVSSSFVLGPHGEVLFTANGDGSSALYRWSNSAIEEVVRAGAAVGDGRLSQIGNPVQVNARGDILLNGSLDARSGSGLFLWSDGVGRLVLYRRDPNPCQDTVQSISDAVLSPSGDVFVLAGTSGGRGILRFEAATGALEALVCPDRASPTHGTFKNLGSQIVGAGGAGVVFQARVAPVSPPAFGGLFLHDVQRCAPDSVCAVATNATVLPGGAAIKTVQSADVLGSLTDGDVLFRARTVGGGRVLATARDGAINPLVRLGDACPSGGTFVSLSGAAQLGAGGALLFAAECSDSDGVYRRDAGGALARVAGSSDATRIGEGFAFSAGGEDAVGNVVATGTRTGVFLAQCEQFPCAAITAVAAPFAKPDAVPSRFVSFGAVSGGAGAIAFTAGAADANAAVVGVDGAFVRVASSGDVAPGTSGQALDLIATTAAAAGPFAFVSGLIGDGPAEGVFLSTPEVVSAVAFDGDEVAGRGVISTLDTPSVDDDGDVAFAGDVDNVSCVLRRSPGSAISAVACTGDAAPDGMDGTILSVGAPEIGGGRLFFTATLVLPDNTTRACIVEQQASGAAPTVFSCDGDPAPAGGMFESIAFGPLAAGSNGFAFTSSVLEGDAESIRLFVAPQGTAPREVLRSDTLRLDLDGGTRLVSLALNRHASLQGTRVAFAAASDAGLSLIAVAASGDEEEPSPTAPAASPTPSVAPATLSPTATPTASAKPDASPTVTPMPPLPSATRTATATTASTATPTPTATASATASPTGTPALVGDLNCDEGASVADVVALIRLIAAGSAPPCPFDDPSGDDALDAADVAALSRVIFE